MCMQQSKLVPIDEDTVVYKVIQRRYANSDVYKSPYHEFYWEKGKEYEAIGNVDSFLFYTSRQEIYGGAFHTFKNYADALWASVEMKRLTYDEVCIGVFIIPKGTTTYEGRDANTRYPCYASKKLKFVGIASHKTNPDFTPMFL